MNTIYVIIKKLKPIFSQKQFVKFVKKMGYKYLIIGPRKTRCYMYKEIPAKLIYSNYLIDGGNSFLLKDLKMYRINELTTNVVYEL